MSVISRFKALLFGSVAVTPQAASRAAAPEAHNPTPPPGEGWRATSEPDAQGRYFVWKDATAMAVFYDRDAAQAAADKWRADEPQAPEIDPWTGHQKEAEAALAAQDESGHSPGFGVDLGDGLTAAKLAQEPALITESPPCQMAAPNPEREAARASGARWWVEGPKADGLFWVYTWDRAGLADPRKGYTRRRNAQAVVNARLEDG